MVAGRIGGANITIEGQMGAISIRHWFIIIVVLAMYAVPITKIVERTGHSKWWAVVFFIPLFHLVALWVLAFVKWPAMDRTSN